MSDAWHSSHASSRQWRRGAWALELRDDELADIRFDGLIVLRSIRAVVRDHDWNTAAWRIEGIGDESDGISLTLAAHGDGARMQAALRAHVRGDELEVVFTGHSLHDYDTNRTGLVVLHPPHLSGAPLHVTHPDGTVHDTAFPREISPHQPAERIARLTWPDGARTVDVRFDGDVFEMEDQRNWTDASFKTYSRPLALPFPYRIDAGVPWTQRVSVRVDRDEPAHPAQRAQTGPIPPETIELSPTAAFPDIGVSAASAPDPAPEVAPLGRHLLVELDLASTNWRAALARASASPLPLDVRLIVPAGSEAAIDAAIRALAPIALARVGVFRAPGHALQHVSDDATLRLLRAALASRRREGIEIVGGSRSHFTELNRELARIPLAHLDAITTTLTPLFHSHTTEQLVESVAMQRLVALQTVRMAEGRPVHIGPIALRPRFNDVATATASTPTRTDLSEGYGAQFTSESDARQDAPELAAWTIASAAALAVDGVRSVTWYEQWGPRGIRTSDGSPRPVTAALERLTELQGRPAWTGSSADGLVWALGSPAHGTLVANLDERERTVALRAPTDDSRARTTVAAGTVTVVPDRH